MVVKPYLVFVVRRTVKIDLLDKPARLKLPNLVCVYSGRCTEELARKIAGRYQEAYFVEATHADADGGGS